MEASAPCDEADAQLSSDDVNTLSERRTRHPALAGSAFHNDRSSGYFSVFFHEKCLPSLGSLILAYHSGIPLVTCCCAVFHVETETAYFGMLILREITFQRSCSRIPSITLILTVSSSSWLPSMCCTWLYFDCKPQPLLTHVPSLISDPVKLKEPTYLLGTLLVYYFCNFYCIFDPMPLGIVL